MTHVASCLPRERGEWRKGRVQRERGKRASAVPRSAPASGAAAAAAAAVAKASEVAAPVAPVAPSRRVGVGCLVRGGSSVPRTRPLPTRRELTFTVYSLLSERRGRVCCVAFIVVWFYKNNILSFSFALERESMQRGPTWLVGVMVGVACSDLSVGRRKEWACRVKRYKQVITHNQP